VTDVTVSVVVDDVPTTTAAEDDVNVNMSIMANPE